MENEVTSPERKLPHNLQESILQANKRLEEMRASLEEIDESTREIRSSQAEMSASLKEIRASQEEMDASLEKLEASHKRSEASLNKLSARADDNAASIDNIAAETANLKEQRSIYADLRAHDTWLFLNNIQTKAIEKIKTLYPHDKLQQLLNNQIEISPCEQLAMKDATTRQLLRDSLTLTSDSVPDEYSPWATGHYIDAVDWPYSTALWIKAATRDPYLAESARTRLPTIEALTLMAAQLENLDAVVKRGFVWSFDAVVRRVV